MTESDRAIEADVERVAAVARQRLSTGANIDELLRSVRPPSPHPDARQRDDGPLGAPWRQPQTPLLGLAHLTWKPASPRTMRHVCDALSLPEPLLVRVAATEVFRAYRLLHVIFGKIDSEYDLLMSADLQRPADKPVVFNWTGSPVAEVLKRSRGDLAQYPAEYLRIFCGLTGSDAGRFAVVDADDGQDERRGRSLPIVPEDARRALRDVLKRRCSPPKLRSVGADGALQYRTFILHQQALFMSGFQLSHNGRVEMKSDQVLWALGS